MIPQSHVDYYGDQTRWFIGVVVDIKDPLQMGRVRVRIHGVHSDNTTDIPDADLPWAQTVVPVTEGGSSGTGTNVGIQIKAQVFGMFLDGKASQLPLVLGSIPKLETVSNPEKKPTTLDVQPPLSLETKDTLLKGNTNVEKAYNFFISKGFTPVQAAGMIGNFIVESGRSLDPTIISGVEGEGSQGIAQWNPAGGRLQDLKKFAQSIGYPYTSLYAQLNFVVYELYGKEQSARKRLQSATSVDEAAYLFAKYYERPASKDGLPLHLDRRQASAKQVYKDFEYTA